MTVTPFREYDTPMSTCYTPNFVSEVSRVCVLKEPHNGMEIIVEPRNGSPRFHRYSELEAVLAEIVDEAPKGCGLVDDVTGS
jgi:hypothetical protein